MTKPCRCRFIFDAVRSEGLQPAGPLSDREKVPLRVTTVAFETMTSAEARRRLGSRKSRRSRPPFQPPDSECQRELAILVGSTERLSSAKKFRRRKIETSTRRGLTIITTAIGTVCAGRLRKTSGVRARRRPSCGPANELTRTAPLSTGTGCRIGIPIWLRTLKTLTYACLIFKSTLPKRLIDNENRHKCYTTDKTNFRRHNIFDESVEHIILPTTFLSSQFALEESSLTGRPMQ